MAVKPKGSTHIYSFPFWIFVDQECAPKTRTYRASKFKIRIYPPFRMAAANFTTLPPIEQTAIPFLASARKRGIPKLDFISPVIYPTFDRFPDGKTSLQAVWDSTWDRPPRYMPMDSLRLDILTDRYRDTLDEVALNTKNDIIQRLRLASSQWWIGYSVSGMIGEHRAAFPITADGSPVEQPWGRASGSTTRGLERPIDDAIWNSVIDDMRAGLEKDLAESLYLDSLSYSARRDIKMFIMSAAMALEVARDAAFSRVPAFVSQDGTFKRGSAYSSDDLRKQLDNRTKRVFGRSLKTDIPTVFEKIEGIWLARNNVAHGKLPDFRRGQQVESITTNNVREFADAVYQALTWIRGLHSLQTSEKL